MTRLGPGWLCQPNVPLGAMMFSTMWTSVAPLTLIRARQRSFLGPGSTSVLAEALMPSKRAMTGDQGGLVTPEGGVARAGTTTSAAVAAAAARAIPAWRRRGFIWFSFGGCGALCDHRSGAVAGRRVRCVG